MSNVATLITEISIIFAVIIPVAVVIICLINKSERFVYNPNIFTEYPMY